MTEKAIFAGGHFWYMVEIFSKVYGVNKTIAGYTGDKIVNPEYEQVSNGLTGYYHSIMIVYNSETVSYEKLLYIFWRNIDPTDYRGQFADRGSQYRTAIFYLNEEQRGIAEKSKEEIKNSGIFKGPIATEILPAEEFYPAQEDHQNYHKKCPMRYNTYKIHSGRKEFLKNIWWDK